MSPELADKIVEVSDRLGLDDPAHLANLISGESNFDPAGKNPKSTATGLIQFIESTAKGLGTTTAELKQMTAVDQMKYVEAYLKDHLDRKNIKNPTFDDILAATFYPRALGKGRDYVLFQDQDPEERAKTVAANDGIETFGDYMRIIGKHHLMTLKDRPKTEPTPET